MGRVRAPAMDVCGIHSIICAGRSAQSDANDHGG
ncbi:hypothetical protein CEXT_309281, partial [Caerostris extrusa]